MKQSIACTVLLASLLLACSHGVEQQVHRWEQTASNPLFADPEDYGVEGRQGYPVDTLPPTPSSGPTAGGGYGNPETLPPTPSSGPTTGGGYGNPETLPPTPSSGPTAGGGYGNQTFTPPLGFCPSTVPPCYGVNCTFSYCYELIECMETITGIPFDFCGVPEEEVCNVLLHIYGGPKGVEAACNAASLFQGAPVQDPGLSYNGVFRGLSSTSNAKTRTLQEPPPPTCETPVDPDYPDESGDNTDYDRMVAGIVNTFLKNGKTKRSNDDAVAVHKAFLYVAMEAAAAAEACDGDLQAIFTAGACVVGKTGAAIWLASMEIVQDQLDFHDGGIDASEIAATLENTNRILAQTCSIIGQVDQRFDLVDAALQEANEKLDSIQRGIDEANEKLDRLLCPFDFGPNFTVLGQGCDATDQNCNNVTDECAEDNVPPSITLRVPIPDIPFKSTDDAFAFLEENVIVSDDCATTIGKGFALNSPPDCCDCQFQVSATDERCVNDAAPGAATASRIFLLKVDRDAPVITCGFFTQQDPFHVSGGFDPCGGLPVPFPGENDPLHIDQTCFGPGLLDVELWYQIEDECDKGVLPVTVQVLSNELEGRPSEEKMAFIVERNDLPRVVHRAEVFLSPTSCQDEMTSGSKGSKGGSKGSKGSGKQASTICKIERTEGVTTRFYDITISATDAAGNVGTKTCSVIVIPYDHYCAGGNCAKAGGKNKGAGNLPKGMQNGLQRGLHHLESFDDFSGRNLQLPKRVKRVKKVKQGSKGLLNNDHDPDDLRREFALSTQRYVISELSLEFDQNLDTVLTIPEPETNVGNAKSAKTKTGKAKGSKSGQRSCPISCEGAQGKRGKKQTKGVQNVTNLP